MKQLLQAFLLCGLFVASHAQPIVLNNPNQTYPIFQNSAVLEMEPGKVTIDSLLNHPDRFRFISVRNSTKIISSTKERWFRFEVRSALETAVCLYYNQPLPGPVTLYLVYNNQLEKIDLLGKDDKKLTPTYPLRFRKIWPLSLQPNKDYVIYWHSAELPTSIVISPLDRLLSLFHIDDQFGGFYYGFVLIIILYNLLLFARLKDLDHLVYATWVGLLSFVYGIQLGYFHGWMPVYYDFFTKHILIIHLLTATTHILFGMSFLHVSRLSKKLYWLGVGLISLMALTSLAEIIFAFLTKEQSASLGFLSFLFDIIFTIIAGSIALQKGFKPAWYYLLGILLIFIGVSVSLLLAMGQLPLNFLTQNSLLLASMAEIILFTLALSYKVNLLKQQRETAIANQLKLSEENRQLVETQNRVLEEKVEQRTAELRASQAQLIQKEKLASLGELTAGIAHEIQNPLNFVNNFAEVSTELVEEQKEALAKGDLEEVGFIADDLRQNLEKITHHGKRASAIVNGMLEHSKGGAGEKQETDLVRLTQECFNIAYQGYRSKYRDFSCELLTRFEPETLSVPVVTQDIGRVVINVLNNAFYSVRERSTQQSDGYVPQIGLSITRHTSYAEVVIKDNGTGIPASIREKIFQPFFTTKPTGEGTGLGLSLSYDIIAKGHGGDVLVDSEEGQGSEFTIRLPT